MLRTVGVTGGQGFIGTHVRDRLRDLGYKVVIFDRAPHGELHSNETFFLGDVRDATSVTEFVAHVDGVIHLAAVLGTQETIQNPIPAVETNILGSINVLQALAQYDVPAVYAGVGNHWMREHAGGSYTITKTAVEDFIKTFNKNKGTRVSVVRPVNAYGPGQSVAAPYGSSKVRKIIPSFVCRALLDDPIEVYGDGTQISDCVHVRDVAKVFVRALEHTAENGPLETPAEVGPVHSVTVGDIAYLVKELTHSYSVITHLPMRPGEVPNAVVSADPETLTPLGLYASDFISLEDGLRETISWFEDNWLLEYRSE